MTSLCLVAVSFERLMRGFHVSFHFRLRVKSPSANLTHSFAGLCPSSRFVHGRWPDWSVEGMSWFVLRWGFSFAHCYSTVSFSCDEVVLKVCDCTGTATIQRCVVVFPQSQNLISASFRLIQQTQRQLFQLERSQ